MKCSTDLRCSLCQKKLPDVDTAMVEAQSCPECDNPYRIDIFPAMLKKDNRNTVEKSSIEGDASCFFHADNKAVIPCSSCGRFLCSLCDIPFGDAHICPKCIERGQDSGKSQMKNEVVQYDNIALWTAILPAMFIWGSIIGAPIALYIVIRYFKKPCSILPRTKIRFYIAGLLALGEIGFMVFLILSITYGWMS